MPALVQTLFILIVVFQVKHLVCDFVLQRRFMVIAKRKADWSFAVPLSLHCAIHGFFTMCICLAFNPMLWWLAILDFIIHFVMDRIKSGPRYLGRFGDMTSHAFWNCFGFDQMVHHLTHYFIIYQILTHPV